MRFGAGAPATGFLIVAVTALLAQARVLGCGLVWDDVVLLAQDARIRDVSFVFRAFGDAFFGDVWLNEMYRPVVNASLTLDWHLSGSSPEDVRAWWFHGVNLLLHAANAGLLYLLLANLMRRFLGAPLLAACLFAVHPIATETTAWIVGRCDLLAAFFGLLSALLLARTPKNRRLLWPALAFYALALFAKASAAFLPLVVAFGVLGYHGMPARQLFSKRVLPRFAAFAVPAVIWLAARAAVLGAPFPRDGGLRWHSTGAVDALQGVGRALWVYGGQLLLPARLSGDYLADPAFSPATRELGADAWIGMIVAAGALVWSLANLRRFPRVAFPLAAGLVLLIPTLQVVRIGAIFADRFLYLPMGFLLLLVGEGLERLFVWGRKGTIPLTFGLLALLGVLSHLRAPAWDDDVAFNHDVLRVYPGARQANLRLASALAEVGDAERDEARARLEHAIDQLRNPDEECLLLGALLIEDGRVNEAVGVLRRGIELAGDKPELGANLRYNLAVARRRQGRDDEARALLAEALERIPGHAESVALLTRLGERGHPTPGVGGK